MIQYNPNHMLDALIEKMGLENDAAFAQRIKLARPIVAMLREGRMSISASMMMWFHEASGISMKELRQLIGDRRLKYRLSCR